MSAPSFWTPERVARLRDLWDADELSGSGIANELGAASRSAVVSKARRLNLRYKQDARRRNPLKLDWGALLLAAKRDGVTANAFCFGHEVSINALKAHEERCGVRLARNITARSNRLRERSP